MVEFVSQYDSLVNELHSSDNYQNGTDEQRKAIDRFLESEKVKKYFGGKVVPQLTFHESFVLMTLNSLQGENPEKQEKVKNYLNSKKVKSYLDRLEKKLS